MATETDAANVVKPLLARALFAFLVLPATVAVLVPWLLVRGGTHRFHPLGLAPLCLGAVLLLWCVRDFYVVGQGTLAPWSPPKQLVEVGLYRYSRNPMYLAVLVILCGWAVAFPSWRLWAYAAAVAIAFHLRIVFGEEPWLARTHGEAWTKYQARTPRWLF